MEARAFHQAWLATRDRDEALDLVQEAMLRLASRYGRRDPSQWPPLFQRILQNLIRDWARRRRVRLAWQRLWGVGLDEDDEDHRPDGRDHRPEDALRDRRAMDALDQALAELPLRQRQAVLLRLWEGLDVAETARAMGCSQGSVKTHYARGLQALRRRLEDHWP